MDICGEISDNEEDDEEGYSQLDAVDRPQQVILTRHFFEVHKGTATFDSWEQLVSAVLMEEGEQGKLQDDLSGSNILDPVQIFGSVATVLIEACVWGLVGYYMMQNTVVGLVLTILYGIGLLLAVYILPSQLAGMVWPNIPCVIGATGVLLAVLVKGSDLSDASPGSAGLILLVCIVPQTLAAAAWMYKLPEDPDRASLFSNLFLGLWAAVQALFIIVMGNAKDTLFGDRFWGWFHFAFWALLLQSGSCIVLTRYLFVVRSRWSSAELVSWTLNLGALGLAVSVSALLNIPYTDEMWRWLLFSLLVPGLVLLGLLFGRAVPTMLGGICLLMATFRLSLWVGSRAGSPLAAFGTFGCCGAVVLAAAAGLRRCHSNGDQQQSTAVD